MCGDYLNILCLPLLASYKSQEDSHSFVIQEVLCSYKEVGMKAQCKLLGVISNFWTVYICLYCLAMVGVIPAKDAWYSKLVPAYTKLTTIFYTSVIIY
jgi:hypothetical protein